MPWATPTHRRQADHVEHEGKSHESLSLRGRAPGMVNESGLYSLILGSKKPEAKAFKKWVPSVVLPAIRKRQLKGEECSEGEIVRMVSGQAQKPVVVVGQAKCRKPKGFRISNSVRAY